MVIIDIDITMYLSLKIIFDINLFYSYLILLILLNNAFTMIWITHVLNFVKHIFCEHLQHTVHNM